MAIYVPSAKIGALCYPEWHMTSASWVKTLIPFIALLLVGGGVYVFQKNGSPSRSSLTNNPIATGTSNTTPQTPPAPQAARKPNPLGPDVNTIIGTEGSITYYFVSTRIGSGGLSTPRNIELNIIRSYDATTQQEKDLDILPVELSYTKFIDENTWQPHGQAQIKDGHILANVYSAQAYIRPNQERLPIQINKIALPKK